MQSNLNGTPDKIILDKIKAEALADAPKPDFKDLKKRIAALPADADKDDGLGYRDMFPAGKKPPLLRYAAAAAAIVAVAGIAAAARNISFGGNMASEASYSAESANMYEDAMEAPAEAYMSEAEDAAPEAPAETTTSTYPADADNASFDGAAFNSVAEETAFGEDDAVITENSEDGEKNGTDVSGTDTAESAAQNSPSQNSTALSENEEDLYDFYVKDLGITLGVPYQAFCTGPDVPDNFPPLERFGMTAEQLMSNYKSRGICFNAVWYGEDGADVIEIVVSSEDVSDKINNLSSLSEYDMEQLRQSYMRYGTDSPDSPRYYDVSAVSLKGQPYIRALGKDYAGKACHAQYMTIVNGRRVKISLIEHYSETDAIPEEGVSPAHVSLMDSVAASIRYDHIRSNFVYRLSRLRPTVWVSLLGILVLIVYGIHYLIERKKHPVSGDEMSDEVPAAEARDGADTSGEDLSDDAPSDDGQRADETPEDEPSGKVPTDDDTADGGGADAPGGDTEEKA